jgi:hypothetical protein
MSTCGCVSVHAYMSMPAYVCVCVLCEMCVQLIYVCLNWYMCYVCVYAFVHVCT